MIKNKKISRIIPTLNNGRIFLPIGHYALVTSEDLSKIFPISIRISGLGSCIALIMYDKKNEIHAMSHILLPEKKTNKKYNLMEYPHKYVDSSVRELFNDFLALGAEKRNIKACIIGGADIFRNGIYSIGEKNIKKVREELKKMDIPLECEEVGGYRGRVIKYDINKKLILSKFTGEDQYRVLNKIGGKKIYVK